MSDAEPAATPVRRRRRRGWWIALGVSAAALLGLWVARAPIADNFIRQQLDQRGVPASYTIEKIGFRTQRLTNIVIGNAKRPDLTARSVEVTIGYGLSGPYVSSITADRVRLYGRFADGKLTLGALDKFRDPTSTDPLALPDLVASLSDARARIATPWGDVGAVVDGRGNLRESFTGTLALISPAIAASGCTARDISFYGRVTVRNVQPRLVGPLRGASMRCDAGRLAAASPQIALDVALSESLTDWKGKADASIATLVAGDYRSDRIGMLAQFSGNADRTSLTIDAAMARLRGPEFAAESVTIDAVADVGRAPAKLDGNVEFARASASAALRQSIARGGAGLAGSPIGPLADKAGGALARMLANVGGSSEFALVGEGRTTRFELIAPQLTSASGARFVGSDDSRIAYLLAAPRPAFVAAGTWRFGGGDLPTGSLTLDRQADGSVSGSARFEPYVAGGARLALAPVRFSGGRGGLIRFATSATLSGPLADGRVEQLLVPIDGVLSPTGALALKGGCTRIGVASVAASGFRFGRNSIDLCSRPGQPLLGFGPKGLSGGFTIPRLALRGTSGASPLAISASQAQIDLASMRWAVALADVRLGEGEAATQFSADAISGRSAANGQVGELTGAAGKIGAVPLMMSEIGGAWRWSNSALALDGSLVVSDAETDARFAPLISRDAQLRFAGGAIDATASFAERKTGAMVVKTVIRHELGDGSGHADLTVDELRFTDDFQPDQLTQLAQGVVALFDGSVVGDGRIDWSPDGVTSRGTFATSNSNFAAAFGPVTGLSTTLTFDDLLGLHSPPNQKASIDEINPGIPVVGGEIEYQLLGNNQIRVEGGRWPFAGGELLLHPTTLNFNADQPRRLSFDLVGVDAAAFLQQFGFDNINATGVFDGTLPVEFDGLGGRIVDGRIDSRSGGGSLAYVGELSNRNLGVIANFAFGALRSLKYDDLAIILNGDLAGEMVTDIRFGGVGQGEGATRNFLTRRIAALPLVFNVKITAPFRALVTSAKGFYDPSLLIEQNLPALIAAQEAQRLKQEQQVVQPPESEPMP